MFRTALSQKQVPEHFQTNVILVQDPYLRKYAGHYFHLEHWTRVSREYKSSQTPATSREFGKTRFHAKSREM